MTVQEVWDWLNALAPFQTQEDFDNAGLLVGDPKAEVHHVFFTLDATLSAVREAERLGAELIVTHHPLMFGGIHTLRYDEPEGAALAAIAAAGMHLIAAHTNLDRAAGGTGETLALALGLEQVAPSAQEPYLWVGTLPAPQSARTFLAALNARLGGSARLYGDAQANISRVAVGPGALGEAYEAAVREGAQAFVVGEIKHHQLIAARALGLTVLEAGHYFTEQPGIEALYQRFVGDTLAGHGSVRASLTTIQPYGPLTAHSVG